MVFAGPYVVAQTMADAFTAAGYPAHLDIYAGNSGLSPAEGEGIVEVLGDGQLEHAQEIGRLYGYELRMHAWVEESA